MPISKRITNHRGFPSARFAVATFFAVLILLLSLMTAVQKIRNDLLRQEMQFLTVNTAAKVTKVITELIWKVETLATLVVQGNGEVDDFDKIAAILVDDAAIRNVSLAPGGIVKQIFPLRGNESVLDLDFLNSGGGIESRSAMESGKLTLAGPIKMVQGGEALTGRLPVYLKNREGDCEFWGFVGIALNYPQVLDYAFLDELYQHGFAGEIWRISTDTGKRQTIWQSRNAVVKEDAEESTINLFNVTWHMSISRLPSVYGNIEYGVSIFLLLFISFLVATLVYHYLELRKMKNTLESMAMTDTLTGLPNRRHLMKTLEQAVDEANRTGNPLTLLYLDLNGFKQVNDVFGHDEGDRVLIESAGILKKYLGARGTAARVGGDEFIILLPDTDDTPELAAMVKRLDEALQLSVTNPSCKPGRTVQVSASFGAATYPKDAKDMAGLLHVADQGMYTMKKHLKIATGVFKNHFR